ncbi:unnamed protein product [Vicia faba]|uniref:Uncharacterized protein n=1 Tax=Vicia faba TaxID=3906 RepID=A0AAV0ZRY1_VICFA|nr:unnamed protein product [Vicia faba]
MNIHRCCLRGLGKWLLVNQHPFSLIGKHKSCPVLRGGRLRSQLWRDYYWHETSIWVSVPLSKENNWLSDLDLRHHCIKSDFSQQALVASDLDSQVTEIIELLERSVVLFAGLKKRAQPQAGTVARLSGGVRHGPRVQAREDQSSCRRTKSKGRVGIQQVRRDSRHEPTQRGHPRTHKRGVGKGPRSPDPAEKREKLQLEVPLE